MAVEILYEGWFQCRLATDRDSYSEPRGRFGWTFAFTGEPDLDRVIRFHDPVALRSHAPAVDVRVTGVRAAGASVPASPLIGAKVSLLDLAVFEGRDGAVAASADEPVSPFHLRIEKNGLTIEASDPMDLANPSDVLRRQPISVDSRTPELLASTGIPDPAAHLRQRLADLQADRAATADPVLQTPLDERIRELAAVVRRGRGIHYDVLVMQLNYAHELSGPHVVADPNGDLPEAVRADRPWRAEYFFGGWDADALCGYTQGKLILAT